MTQPPAAPLACCPPGLLQALLFAAILAVLFLMQAYMFMDMLKRRAAEGAGTGAYAPHAAAAPHEWGGGSRGPGHAEPPPEPHAATAADGRDVAGGAAWGPPPSGAGPQWGMDPMDVLREAEREYFMGRLAGLGSELALLRERVELVAREITLTLGQLSGRGWRAGQGTGEGEDGVCGGRG